jgi:ubiquinone/menaquinone biosynthesis C-methylase UbiE
MLPMTGSACLLYSASMLQEKSFHEIEHEAWVERAARYDDLFSHVTTQAIGPILRSLGPMAGKRHLDVACGTGHLVGAAAARGAHSEGIDFAPTMVDVSAVNYPDSPFLTADAADLPYEDETFDAVSCSFGLLHMAEPQRAVNEAYRVLKPGGRFAFTLWFNNEKAGLLALVQQALAGFTNAAALPESWTRLRYADEAVNERLVKEAGFNRPVFESLSLAWKRADAGAVLDLIQNLSVRTKYVLDSLPVETRKKVLDRILTAAELQKVNGLLTIPWNALLTCAEKPAVVEVQ